MCLYARLCQRESVYARMRRDRPSSFKYSPRLPKDITGTCAEADAGQTNSSKPNWTSGLSLARYLPLSVDAWCVLPSRSWHVLLIVLLTGQPVANSVWPDLVHAPAQRDHDDVRAHLVRPVSSPNLASTQRSCSVSEMTYGRQLPAPAFLSPSSRTAPLISFRQVQFAIAAGSATERTRPQGAEQR